MSMKLIGLVRLGRDAEVRFTASGDPVCGFSGAFNYGRKGEDGRMPSQWVEFSLWGKRAESLQQYLTKGSQVMVVASDVHIETYEKRDGGSGVKLVARVDDVQFAGSRQESSDAGEAPRAAAPRAAAPKAAPAAKSSAGGFDDMDDDIPF